MFIIGSLGPALALDRMGRKKTMMYGVFGLGICMMMASILLSFGKKNTSSAAVAFFFVYMIIFGGSINCVPWVYVRICPPRLAIHYLLCSDLHDDISADSISATLRVLKFSRSRRGREARPSLCRRTGRGTSSSS